MATDTSTAEGQRHHPRRPRSQLFAVRLWMEEVAGGSEVRGSVRDIVSGAFRGFRDWSDLVAFMIGQMEEDESAQTGKAEGEMEWLLRKR